MDTKQKILEAVKRNQPAFVASPELVVYENMEPDLVQHFSDVLTNIGGSAYRVNDYEAVKKIVQEKFNTSKRFATNLPELGDVAGLVSTDIDPHSFQDIELMLMKAHFGIAENGAVWITAALMSQQILPFIGQHLAIVIDAKDIVPTMQHAYSRIGDERYGFGSFISGPSKTADIEQALILGAHGPRTMTVFIMQS